MAVDIVQLFNEHIPGALERNAEDAKTINAKFQLIIDGAGEWFVDCTDRGPTCVAGKGEGPDVTIQATSEDFQTLYENPQTAGMQLFFAGKLKVDGNQMLAMKLSKLFAYK
ncbi:MAG: hypothetical protein CSA75_03020 [Sorangium cellulosum]|nr:MAG: hypothetical protein CSA75_03020 [Sorangium cellulosum]